MIKQNMPVSYTSNLSTHPNHILTKIFFILGMLIPLGIMPLSAHIVGNNGATNIQGDKMIAYPGGKAFFFRLYLSDKHNTPYSLNNPSIDDFMVYFPFSTDDRCRIDEDG